MTGEIDLFDCFLWYELLAFMAVEVAGYLAWML
jgi:hypothetical protein